MQLAVGFSFFHSFFFFKLGEGFKAKSTLNPKAPSIWTAADWSAHPAKMLPALPEEATKTE